MRDEARAPRTFDYRRERRACVHRNERALEGVERGGAGGEALSTNRRIGAGPAERRLIDHRRERRRPRFVVIIDH